LTALHRRLCDRLVRDLDTLRDTVADLLGVALVLPQDGGPLVANPRFPYQFAEDIAQTELLAGWIRRHLPGGYGKKRPRARLARERADPVPMQVGRARSDLQQRLAESIRPVERAVAAHYEAVARRLRVVLDEAEHPAPAGEQLGSALADRASTLRPIIAELTALDGGTPVARSVPGW
ncbi:MAG: hypothetical protein QOF84_2760, partial [Streptomyces sp.]|nr:hypothetical protein [Streptomyces sp.]